MQWTDRVLGELDLIEFLPRPSLYGSSSFVFRELSLVKAFGQTYPQGPTPYLVLADFDSSVSLQE